jgi:hypothetical protein
LLWKSGRSMFMMSFMFVIMCGTLHVFIVCLYFYCRWRSNYQERRILFPWTGLTPPYICTWPMPGLPTSSYKCMSWSLFVFYNLVWDLVVRFVEIVDHNCLNFLCISIKTSQWTTKYTWRVILFQPDALL